MDRSRYNTFSTNVHAGADASSLHFPPLSADLTDYIAPILPENDSGIPMRFDIYGGKDDVTDTIIYNLIYKKEKEALQDMRYRMVDILTKEKVKFTMPKVAIFPEILRKSDGKRHAETNNRSGQHVYDVIYTLLQA